MSLHVLSDDAASSSTSGEPAEMQKCSSAGLVGFGSRYFIHRRPGGDFAFQLRAHNGGVLLSADRDVASVALAMMNIERVRVLLSLREAIQIKRSLTGKWYFCIHDSEQGLARSRPFDYRSRMEKALYAVRACGPASRVT